MTSGPAVGSPGRECDIHNGRESRCCSRCDSSPEGGWILRGLQWERPWAFRSPRCERALAGCGPAALTDPAALDAEGNLSGIHEFVAVRAPVVARGLRAQALLRPGAGRGPWWDEREDIRAQLVKEVGRDER